MHLGSKLAILDKSKLKIVQKCVSQSLNDIFSSIVLSKLIRSLPDAYFLLLGMLLAQKGLPEHLVSGSPKSFAFRTSIRLLSFSLYA